MALAHDTTAKLEARLDSLISSCATLTDVLEAEAKALGTMDLGTLGTIAVDREDALEAVIASDAVLRRALASAARDLGTPEVDVLKEGPLAEALAPKREALKAQRQTLAQTTARVRARANLGLGFFRSALGTTDSYGAGGQARELSVGSAKFYRVV